MQLIWSCELEIKRWDEKSLTSDLVTVTETPLWRSDGLGTVSSSHGHCDEPNRPVLHIKGTSFVSQHKLASFQEVLMTTCL